MSISAHTSRTAVFTPYQRYRGSGEKNKRRFRKFRDDRFALTTLQNPNIEVRTYAELVHVAQQERENHHAAAAIPATQPSADLYAADSISAAQFQEIDAPTAPDPLPAAPGRNVPASPDSANADAANTDSRIEAVRQLAARLCIPVIVETRTVHDSDVEPIRQAAPKARPKSKSHRNSRGTGNPACASSATASETEALDEDDSALPSIELHSRKCNTCRHRERPSIDDAFLYRCSPATIMHWFGIPSETTIYTHAINLFAQRNRNLPSATLSGPLT